MPVAEQWASASAAHNGYRWHGARHLFVSAFFSLAALLPPRLRRAMPASSAQAAWRLACDLPGGIFTACALPSRRLSAGRTCLHTLLCTAAPLRAMQTCCACLFVPRAHPLGRRMYASSRHTRARWTTPRTRIASTPRRCAVRSPASAAPLLRCCSGRRALFWPRALLLRRFCPATFLLLHLLCAFLSRLLSSTRRCSSLPLAYRAWCASAIQHLER